MACRIQDNIAGNKNVNTYTSVTEVVKFFDAYFLHYFPVRYHVVLISKTKHSEIQYFRLYLPDPAELHDFYCFVGKLSTKFLKKIEAYLL